MQLSLKIQFYLHSKIKKKLKWKSFHEKNSWEERHFLIYCYNGGFLIENSLRNLKMHLEWVNNPKWQTVTDTILTIWVIF